MTERYIWIAANEMIKLYGDDAAYTQPSVPMPCGIRRTRMATRRGSGSSRLSRNWEA
jgi:hypothetical protein